MHDRPAASDAAVVAGNFALLADLRWFRIDATLICDQSPPGKPRPGSLLGVIEHFVKAAEAQPGLKVIFRVPGWPLDRLSPIAGRRYPVEIRLFGPEPLAQGWRASFAAQFSEGRARFHRLIELGALEPRSLTDIVVPEPAEDVALYFLTPYGFRHPGRKIVLEPARLIADIASRIERLFGMSVPLQDLGQGISLLPWYWQYAEPKRKSQSTSTIDMSGQGAGAGAADNPAKIIPGIQYLNGCVGPLYLKGRIAPLLPYLALAEEMQLGKSLAFGMGHFRLLSPGPAWFDPHLGRIESLRSIVHEGFERYDDVATALAEAGADSEERLASELADDFTSGVPLPEAHHAFLSEREQGPPRLIERPTPRELVRHLHLNRLLAPVLDRLFEDASVGYRKGYSRETAAERIRQAMADGYRFVLEADIANFFPSIDLDRLNALLDAQLPAADRATRQALGSCLHTGYILGGVYHARERGLAQGSPLSPLLANLYLDAFDKRLLAEGARLVRYADDFVILCHDLQEGERLRRLAETSLMEWGLALHPDKTALKPVGDGFRFLGIDFGPDSQAGVETPLRKPVYITDQGCFLGVSGETLDIRHQGQLQHSLPLHRVSEIIVLGHAAFSSALVRKCRELRIPLSMALSSGYHIATLAPDSKRYHDIAYRQALKYASLSGHERLALAKEFAAGKIEAYRRMYRQRYHPGSSGFLAHLAEAIASIHAAPDVASVRGKEGATAKLCYEELNRHIGDPCFHLRKRDREHPDAINSLLNFGYYLLFTRVNIVVRAVGLNPYLGFLHDKDDRYESLVCDIEELFRARVDRLVLRLINLKVITPQDFRDTDHGQRLTRESMGRFAIHFERELIEPPKKGGVTLGGAIHAQAVSMRDYFTLNRPLLFFINGNDA